VQLNFNLNASGSRLLLEAFGTSGSDGVNVTITAADETGVTLALSRHVVGTGKGTFRLARRKSNSDCLGGYLRKEFIGDLDLLQKKCFIEPTGSMASRRVRILLSTAAYMDPCKQSAFVSFDPRMAP